MWTRGKTPGALLAAALACAPAGAEELRTVTQPRFGFRVSADWRGPLTIDGGVKFIEPAGRALVSVAYLPKGSPGWKPPEEFRKHLSELGGVGDAHTLDLVKLGSRFASRVRYTDAYYPEPGLRGEASLFYTEIIYAPEPDGAYLITYRSVKEEFSRHRYAYLALLRSLALPRPRSAPEAYYRRRDHIVEDLVEEEVRTELGGHATTELDLFKGYAGRGQLGLELFAMQLYASWAFLPRWSAQAYFSPFGAPFGFFKPKLAKRGARARFHPKGATSKGWFGLLGLAGVEASLPAASAPVRSEDASALCFELGGGYESFGRARPGLRFLKELELGWSGALVYHPGCSFTRTLASGEERFGPPLALEFRLGWRF